MSRSIPDKLRLLVAERAGFACEYCLIGQDDLIFSCQVDHIISLKHDGKTVAENLAYSCLPTVRIFQFNVPERVLRRRLLATAGRYPGR